ncbi:MAG: T9SS type A sorting domain-containing protein [Chlorobi bacterium]|nr:T9SS type A sorting domain-containing protein [Chlorobiota bacterium]
MLLTNSPNLSDSVMVSAIENESTLLNAMLRDVLVENPQAAKSDIVQSALDSKTNVMPDYMRNEIDEGRDTIVELEITLSEYAGFKLKEQMAFNSLKRIYRADTNIVDFTDSLLVLYDMMGDLNNKYRKALLYLSNKDTISADSVLSNVLTNFNLSDEQENERQSYADYFAVKKRIIRLGLTSPDSVSISGFNSIYNSGNGIPVVMAEINLEREGLGNIGLPHYQADTSLLKSARVGRDDNAVSIETEGRSFLKLKPNPAGDYFIMEYKLPDSSTNGSISIASVNGINKISIKLKKEKDEIVISTIDLGSGIYIVGLYSGSNLIQSKKLSVIR